MSVKLVLMTRCGCSRTVFVSEPPPTSYVVPLEPKRGSPFIQDEAPSASQVEVREFFVKKSLDDGGKDRAFLYVER